MSRKRPAARIGRRVLPAETVSVALLLVLALAGALAAFWTFPNRVPAGRGTPLELQLLYDRNTSDRPDVEVDFDHDASGRSTVTVQFATYKESEPDSFDLYVDGAPSRPGHNELNFVLRPKWQYNERAGLLLPVKIANWEAKVTFDGYPNQGFTDNGETFEGVVTAAKISVPHGPLGEPGYAGRADTGTTFSIDGAPLNMFDWSGRAPEMGGFERFVGFLVPADETVSSQIALEVTGTNAAAAEDDSRRLFIAGALLGLAGGALTALIPEVARLGSRRSSQGDARG